MSAHDPGPLGPPDTYALRRRVLLAGLLTMLMFLVVAYEIAKHDVDGAWLLIAMALIYLLVTRPLMRPVREAVKLRRRLSYQAWQDQRGEGDEGSRP